MTADADGAFEEIARRHWASQVARLVRTLGPRHLQLAEDVVQEAFVRALRAWPAGGEPRDPEAWLARVAKNIALDGLRRRAIGEDALAELEGWARAKDGSERARSAHAAAWGRTPDEAFDDGVVDDTLRMMFLSAHPLLAEDARVALVLKTVCGFGNSAIAAALLAKEGTVAQRLTRAKARLAAEGAMFEMPSGEGLEARLDDVLAVLHLVFNEGYRAHRGEALVRVDLVHEAIRLCQLLARNPATDRPRVHALLATLFLNGARLPARIDALGEVLTLAEQDRTLWDRGWIAAGMAHLGRSIGGDGLTAYHCEAAIASIHACARNTATTDWKAILCEYDRLLILRDDPIVRLNRAVAVAKVDGPRAGLAALDELDERCGGALDAYALRHAVRAQLAWLAEDRRAAKRELSAALALVQTDPERRMLERRLASLRSGAAAPAW